MEANLVGVKTSQEAFSTAFVNHFFCEYHMSQPSPSLESVFMTAMEKQSETEMLEYAAEACGENVELLKRVEKLITAHCKSASNFLEGPATGLRDELRQLPQTMDIKSEALEAGLAATFASDAAVVMGASGHSVLKALEKRLGSNVGVTLNDIPNERSPTQNLRSSEIPRTESDSRYQLHGEIARGGMGAVLKGRDVDLGRDLAIKVLLDAHKDNPEHIERFVEEAQVGGQLQHPGIVPVYELGQFKDQRPFFTMKLVKGKTLAVILAERKAPGRDLPRLLGIFEQVCQAMAYAHTKGVIHRDLKPANVMVGAFGEVQVMDWGLSKVLKSGGVADEQKSIDKHRDVSVIKTRRSAGSDFPSGTGSDTLAGSVMGTPAYMPPEQAHGEVERLDQRSDVFGLGAILAEILSGKPPYVAGTGMEILQFARRGKLDKCFARLDASGAESELVSICKKSLSVEPEDRFRDAEQISAEVTGYLEGVQERLKQTELARVEAETRSKEEGRRKKLYGAIAGLMLLLALGGAAGIGVYRQKAEAESKRAQAESQLAQSETVRAEAAEANALEQERLRKRADVMRLTAESKNFMNVSEISGLLVAAEAAEMSQELATELQRTTHSTLLEASFSVGGTLIGNDILDDSWQWWRSAQFSADQRWLVVGNGLFDLTSDDPWSSPTILHEDSVQCVAIDATSRWLATGGIRTGADQRKQGVIHLYDLDNLEREATHRTLFIQGTQVKQLEISPNARWLASVSFLSNTVELWDLQDPNLSAPLQSFSFERPNVCGGLAFSPTLPDCLAVGSTNRVTESLTTTVYRLHETQFQKLVELEGSNAVFSAEGSWLGTATVDRVNAWRIQDGMIADEPLVIETRFGVYDGFAITPDGSRLITMHGALEGKIWNLREPDSHPISLVNPASPPAVSPDNRWIVCAGRAWDSSSTDDFLTPIDLADTDGTGTISPDSKWLVIGDRRWDLKNLHTIRTPNSLVSKATPRPNSFFSNPGGELNTLRSRPGSNSFFRRYEYTIDETQVSLEFELGEEVRCARTSDNGNWLAVGQQDGSVNVYDLGNSQNAVPLNVPLPHSGAIRAVAISDDGELLLTTSDDNTARAIRLDPGSGVLSSALLDEDFNGYLSPNGRSAAAISKDKHWLTAKRDPEGATLWKLNDDLQLVDRFQIPGDKMDWEVQFSPNSRWALTRPFSNPREMLWDLNAEDPIAAPIELRGRSEGAFHTAATFSRDSSLLVAGENYAFAHVWNLKAPDPASTHVKLKHGRSVVSVAISPDNKWVATGGLDSTIRVWCMDDADPSANPILLVGHENDVYGLDFHPKLPILASHSGESIRFWNLDLDSAVQQARRLAGRELSPSERKQLNLPAE